MNVITARTQSTVALNKFTGSLRQMYMSAILNRTSKVTILRQCARKVGTKLDERMPRLAATA